MALPTNDKNKKGGKGQKPGGSKFILKPSAGKATGGNVPKKANRTGGTRGS